MTIVFDNALGYAVSVLVCVSCIYTSLAMLTSAIEHLKDFYNKTIKKEK